MSDILQSNQIETLKSSVPQLLVVSGTKKEMGKKYGTALKQELTKVHDILYDYFVIKHDIDYEKLVDKAKILFDKYPSGYQEMIESAAKAANLTTENLIVVNGMETLLPLLAESKSKNAQIVTETDKAEVAACSFVSIPPAESKTGSTIIGRNYDYPKPFDESAKHLVVLMMKEAGAVSTASIGMAGQIYCPTCVNEKDVFIELNNGMPSGGYQVDNNRISLLINLLEASQSSKSLNQLEKHLSSILSDYSLIINVADGTKTKSFEYSSNLGLKTYTPHPDHVFASTNFYLNQTWTEIPEATDNSTWLGVSRRDNILKHFKEEKKYDVADVKKALSDSISSGGASWDSTIYQIAYEHGLRKLHLRISENENSTWSSFDLNSCFNDVPDGLYSPLAENTLSCGVLIQVLPSNYIDNTQ